MLTSLPFSLVFSPIARSFIKNSKFVTLESTSSWNQIELRDVVDFSFFFAAI